MQETLVSFIKNKNKSYANFVFRFKNEIQISFSLVKVPAQKYNNTYKNRNNTTKNSENRTKNNNNKGWRGKGRRHGRNAD